MPLRASRVYRKSACFLTGCLNWGRWRLRERRPGIQVADVLRSNPSLAVLLEWRGSGAVCRVSPRPGARGSCSHSSTPPPPLILDSPDLLQMESPRRQTHQSAATKDFRTLAAARKPKQGASEGPLRREERKRQTCDGGDELVSVSTFNDD